MDVPCSRETWRTNLFNSAQTPSFSGTRLVPMTVPLRATLYRSVTDARTRLKAVEEEYESRLRDDPMTPCAAGEEYAARVQEYSNAVMAWLGWLHTHGKEGRG